MRRAPLLWFAALALCAGCPKASSTNGPANYQGAAIGAAFGVAAAGVNRAITGDCWASCRDGTRCNRKSGLCERVVAPENIPAPYPTTPPGAEELLSEDPAEIPDAGVLTDAETDAPDHD